MALPKQQKIETMSGSEARKHFSDVVTRPLRGEGRVIVEKSGTPVGAIVSIEDVRRLEEIDRENERRREELRSALEETRRAFDDVPPEEIERQIAQAIDEVNAARRERRAGASVTDQ